MEASHPKQHGSSKHVDLATTSVTSPSDSPQQCRGLARRIASPLPENSQFEEPPHPDDVASVTFPGDTLSDQSSAQDGPLSVGSGAWSHGAGNQQCRGKAPPIEFFTGEDQSTTIDDWLLSLEHALGLEQVVSLQEAHAVTQLSQRTRLTGVAVA